LPFDMPFDSPFGSLRVLSNVEGLRVPSSAEGASWRFDASRSGVARFPQQL
jgi:hypothetical protein